MYKDKVVLCGASAYEQKYYFNEDFASLPQSIQDELHIMCVLYTEEIGGVLTLEFDEEGSLSLRWKLWRQTPCLMRLEVC